MWIKGGTPIAQLCRVAAADREAGTAALLRQRNRVLIRRVRSLQSELQRQQAFRRRAEDRVAELEERTRTNAANSHLPPRPTRSAPSVTRTLALRRHDALDYLTAAISAHRNGQPAPPIPQPKKAGLQKID